MVLDIYLSIILIYLFHISDVLDTFISIDLLQANNIKIIGIITLILSIRKYVKIYNIEVII